MDWLFHAMKNGVRVRAHVYIQGDEMNKFRGFVRCHKILASLVSIGILGAALCGAKLLRSQSASETNAPMQSLGMRWRSSSDSRLSSSEVVSNDNSDLLCGQQRIV